LEFVSVSGGAKKSGPEGYDVVIFGEGRQAGYGGGTALNQGMIDAGEELTIQEGGRTASLKLDKTYTVESAIKKLNDIAEKNGLEVTVENNGGSIGVTHNKYGAEYSFLLRSSTPGVLSRPTGDPSIIKNGSDVSGLINGESAIGRGQELTGRRGNATTEGLTVRWKGAQGVAIAPKPNGTAVGKISIREGFRFQVGANPDQAVSVAMGNMSSSQLARGVKNESGFQSLADLDVRSTTGANDAIRVVDEAINQVATTRGSLGAFQRNTLESNLTSLRIASENMTSAESTIRDADMAKELATFTRNQIMTQSAMAQLAQANAMPQNVLRLLANQ
jgi:flagellin